MIKICRESSVEVDRNDIEGCHRLLVSRYSRGDNKRVIVKFIIRKHPEILLYKKKSLSSREFLNINIPSKIFVFISLCPNTNLFGVNVKTFREDIKCIRYFTLVEQFQLSFPKVEVL